MQKFIPVVVIKEISETDKILIALKKSGIMSELCGDVTFMAVPAEEFI